MSLSEDERKAFEKALKEAEAEGQRARSPRPSARWSTRSKTILQANADRRGRQRRWCAIRSTSSSPSRRSSFKIEALDIRSPQRKADVEKVYKTLWPAVEAAIDERDRKLNSHEARRRAAQRRAADGQGLHRRQAGDLGRRQDGRPARQQGRDRQDSAGGRHAVPGRRHAGADPAQSAGRAQPYERRPDSGNAPGLGRRASWASRRSRRCSTGPPKRTSNDCARTKPACRRTARRSCTTAAPASRSSRRPRSATSTC